MDFTQPWNFGDGIFILEDKKIYINKATLAMSSEVFNTMFMADFAEKEMKEIPLPEKKFDDFVVLMQAVHPPHSALADDKMENNVECILPLAHEYQMHHVVENCEKYLLTQPASIHNLVLADRFSLPALRHVLIQYVKEIPYKKLSEDPEFQMADKKTVCEVLQYRLELHEGKDPLKNIVCKLMSEPASIKNLILAKKYDIPEVYEKCLQYFRDTPLSQLKQEEGFTNLIVDTLLTKKYEALHTKVSKIASWGPRVVCPSCSCYKGTHRGCSECQKCSCTSGNNHQRGTNRDCTVCKVYKFDEFSEVMKKY